jgi:hypothetical protein
MRGGNGRSWEGGWRETLTIFVPVIQDKLESEKSCRVRFDMS